MTAIVPTAAEFDALAARVAILEDADPGNPDPPTYPELPPGSIVLEPSDDLEEAVADAPAGAVLVLMGGTYHADFIIAKRPIIIAAHPAAELVELTKSGRPDFLYLEANAVLRGLTFRSQSTGFDDSQGAALSEVRSPNGPVDLVWYDRCTFIGTSKMADREQLLYIAEKNGNDIAEVRVSRCTFDGDGTDGYGIHPYSGPTPRVVNVTDTTFRRFGQNAAVLNAASGGVVNVDRCVFEDTATYARGMYGPVNVSNSVLDGSPRDDVNDLGGNT